MSAPFRTRIITATLVIGLLVVACNAQPKATALLPKDSNAAYTEAAETIAAGLTANAPSATEIPAEATNTELPPPAVVEALPSPTATLEPLPVTSTPLPTRTPLPSDTPLPSNTPIPTLAAAPALTSTLVLTAANPGLSEPNWVLAVKENFSFTEFWPQGSFDDAHMHFTQGGYAIKNLTIQDVVWAVRTSTYSDVRAEVDANRISGPFDGYYGIICHFGNGSNYYFLGVGSDGWYGIGKQQGGVLTFLQEGKGSLAVLTGNAVNHVRADCVQGALTLYVNNTQLLQVQDTTFTGGSVGLGVGTRKASFYDVLFDNLLIYVIQK